MTGSQEFIDYYSILQVSPGCDVKILQSAYHYLAKKYHPDRSGTANTAKFSAVIEAYRILRDPDKRADYDALHGQHRPGDWAEGSRAADEFHGLEKDALSDADDHIKILKFLYNKRREDAQDAGVLGFYLQEMLGCSDEHFEFHKWYLKEKGFIVVTEQGMLAITIHGIDHVISMSRSTRTEKLLLAQLNGSSD